MNEAALFDKLAADYDSSFTWSITGIHQREQSRKCLLHFLEAKQNLEILDINCGTGVDAIWLSSFGHRVWATDVSEGMIDKAKRNSFGLEYHLNFSLSSFENIGTNFKGQKFDLVFSNFAGLNCLDKSGLQRLMADLHGMLKPGGHVALVVFGKNCLWEMCYYLLTGKPGLAFRRKTNDGVEVPLTEDVVQTIYYHPIKTFRKMKGFKVVETRPVGLFVPPSYLEGLVKKRPLLFRCLLWMERKKSFLPLASLGDHSFILLKRME